MAQWVDAQTSIKDCDQDTLLKYLYLLVYNKAYKASLFKDFETYDDFSLFCVSKLLIRLNNKTEAPVKSIVNYIRTVLTPWHSEYIRCFCAGSAELDQEDFDVADFADYLIDTTAENAYNNVYIGTINISQVVKEYLKLLPKKKHSPEWTNIYISCMLTIEDRIKYACELHKKYPKQESCSLNKAIRGLRKRSPVLFHIHETYTNYILVLVNELIHVISAELSQATLSRVTPSACLKNMVIAANNDEED